MPTTRAAGDAARQETDDATVVDELAEEAEDRYWAAQAEAAIRDPGNQELTPLAQVKREPGL